MKKLLTILILTLASIVAQAQSASQKSELSFPSGEDNKDARFTAEIIPAPNNTFGYDILMEGRTSIHQPSVPDLPGNEGFKTKEAARKVADVVIAKMKKGEMPPTITIKEMKELKVL